MLPSWAMVLVAVLVSIPAGWLAAQLIRREIPQYVHPAVAVGAFMLLAIWAALVVPDLVLLGPTLLLAWTLLVLGTVDLLTFRLPDLLTLPLTGVGLLLALRLPDLDPIAHFAGAALGFGALYGIAVGYDRIRGREGLGLGDAKLAAAAGAWLGWRPLPALLLVACAAAFIAIGLAVVTRGKSALQEEIAFGVPLCLAFWLVWLYGPLWF